MIKKIAQQIHDQLPTLNGILVEIVHLNKNYNELSTRLLEVFSKYYNDAKMLHQLFSHLLSIRPHVPNSVWLHSRLNGIHNAANHFGILYIKDRETLFEYLSLVQPIDFSIKSIQIAAYLDTIDHQQKNTELNTIYSHLQSADPDFITEFKKSTLISNTRNAALTKLTRCRNLITIESTIKPIQAIIENDVEFMKCAIGRNPMIYMFASNAVRQELRSLVFLKNRPIYLELVQYLPKDMREDCAFLQALLDIDPQQTTFSTSLLDVLPTTLKDDAAFLLKLARYERETADIYLKLESLNCMRHASSRLLNDIDFALQMIDIWPRNYLDISETLQRDDVVITRLLSRGTYLILSIPISAQIFKNKEQIMRAMKQILWQLDDVKKYGELYRKIDVSLRQDEDIVKFLLDKFPSVYLDFPVNMHINMHIKKTTLASMLLKRRIPKEMKKTFQSILNEIKTDEAFFFQILTKNPAAFYMLPKAFITPKIALLVISKLKDEPTNLFEKFSVRFKNEWFDLLTEVKAVMQSSYSGVAAALIDRSIFTVEKAREFLKGFQSPDHHPIRLSQSTSSMFSNKKRPRQDSFDEDRNERAPKRPA